MHIILCGGILLYRLKRKIKFIVVFLIIFICCNCVQNSYARTYKGDAINADDKLREVKYEHLTENASYGKYYWTAWNKGTYDFAKVEIFYGIFDYYDKINDTLKLLLISFEDVSYFGSEPINHIDVTYQYYLREVKQKIDFTGSDSDKFQYGTYTPVTEKGAYTVGSGFGVSLDLSEKNNSCRVEYSRSKSESIPNFSLNINKINNYGREWRMTSNRECNESRSEFTSIVSETLYLENASKYNNLQFDISFDFYAKWHLPVCGWEQYDPEKNINKTFQYKINI